MNLIPERISQVQSAKSNQGKSRFSGLGNRLSAFELALVLRQLGILINSGLPLDAALKMLIEQAENARQGRLVESLRAEINEGQSMSAAMRRSPFVLPDSVIASIGVGEETGHLHSVLLRLADELERGAENTL